MSLPFGSALLLTSALGTIAVATPAQAKWETAHGAAIAVGGKCPNAHSFDPQLRATDRRPFDVPAGFSNEIEIYGHGIDLSNGIAASGLPGLTPTLVRKVGGAENALRGCGSIGSVVVRLVVNPSVASATGTLAIGSETFPLRIVNASISGAAWSDATMRRVGSTVGGGTGATASGLVTSVGGNSGCGPVVCPPGGGGAVTSSSSGSSASIHRPDYPSGIGECIAGFGGSAVPDDRFDLIARTLTLTLPSARGAAELACLTRPAIFELRGTTARGDIGGFRAGASYLYPGFNRTVFAPRYTGTTSGLTGPSPLSVPDAHVQTIAMTRDTAAAFVGERQIALASTTPGASLLTLVLRSDPYNGIRTIQGVPFAGARLTSTFEVRFDFLAAFKGPETVAWRIGAVSGASPQTCFTAVNGTATATSAIGKLPITATEAAGCVGSRFTLQIAPTKNGAGVFSAPFVQTAIFTLPARSLPQQISLPPR